MKEIPEEILQLIALLPGGLSVEQQKQLDCWLSEEDANEAVMQEIIRLQEDFSLAEMYESISVANDWKQLKQKTSVLPGWKLKPLLRISRIAAAVFIPLLILPGLWFYTHREATELSAEILSANIQPGTSKALLELSNGEKIILNGDSSTRKLIDKNGNAVGVDSVNQLVLMPSSGSKNSETVHTIYVPDGGEYQLVLSDGTKLWLNSGSTLRFPAVFASNERKVELSGEAFFDVAKDANCPFIVKTSKSEITVLGTSFNISSYNDDLWEQTTLVSGMVAVHVKDSVYQLTPGNRLNLNCSDLSAEIKPVDTQLYTSWKNGMFRFQNMPLDELTVKLGRWYNVRFIFEDEECRNFRFTGAIGKNADIGAFIKMIENTTGVLFAIKNDSIVVVKKQNRKYR
jgi:ferric-dicitrate binding protein FerR (iron transport regulator)